MIDVVSEMKHFVAADRGDTGTEGATACHENHLTVLLSVSPDVRQPQPVTVVPVLRLN